MEIVAFDTDDRADGNGKAGITWISKDLLYNSRPAYNQRVTNVNWRDSDLRTYIKSLKTRLPSILQSGIVEVTKVSSTIENNTIVVNGQTTTDDLWIPSSHEVGFGTDCESIGAVYDNRFSADNDRIKLQYSKTNPYQSWCLRSAHSNYYFKQVTGTGRLGSKDTTSNNGIAIGFCTN